MGGHRGGKAPVGAGPQRAGPGRPGWRRGRAATHRLAEDEAGALMVFEAVLVAILVLSTLLVVSTLQRPATGGDVGGVDLARLAADDLGILQARNFTVNGQEYNMTDWIRQVTQGDADTAAAVHRVLDEILPLGTQYQLRINNGMGSVRILPPDTDRTPLSAQAASTFIFPDWTAFSGEIADTSVPPGAELDWSDWDNLVSPLGTSTGPDGAIWLDIWEEEVGGRDRVPLSALYGVWQYTDAAGCTSLDPCHLLVTAPDGSPLERPLYAIDLVVWYGA